MSESHVFFHLHNMAKIRHILSQKATEKLVTRGTWWVWQLHSQLPLTFDDTLDTCIVRVLEVVELWVPGGWDNFIVASPSRLPHVICLTTPQI